MVVLADEILESFFETDLSASFKLESVPDLELPTSSGGFLEDLWSNIATEDNKKIFHKLSDELGKTIGKHQVVYRPRIGRYTKLEEPKARESLVSSASKSTFASSSSDTLLEKSSIQDSSSTLTVDAMAAQEKGPGSALSSTFSPMPHVKAVNAALMERTPFAIDDAGDDDDDDDDSDLDIVHGEDDDQVMDEVDAFLEAHDSGLTDADKEVAKGEQVSLRTEIYVFS
jgi:TBC1 domain family member 8/9